MEELSGDSVGALGEGIFLFVSVCIVSEDGTSDGGKMDADLVHTPRFEDTFDERIFFMNIGLKNFVMSDGGLTPCLIDDNLVGVFGMFETSKLLADRPGHLGGCPEADSEIDFLDFVRLERSEHHIE